MITLDSMINLLKEKELLKEIIINNEWHFTLPSALSTTEIDHITYDSRDIKLHSLFFCKGLGFKKEYLIQAIQSGATYYVSETCYEDFSTEAVGIIVTDIKKAMAIISMAFYGYPQKELKIIAYTGTKGKTTAAYFSKFILEKESNHKTAMFSTMETILDGKTSIKSQLTTPESVDLYRMMAEAVNNGMTHLIMEVSSQAYKTSRVYELKYDVGIFLNISPDHIGSVEHPNFDDYFYCKRELLKNSKALVLNKDSDYYTLIEETALEYTDQIYTYSDDKEKEADYTFDSKENNHFEVSSSEEDTLGINGTYEITLSGDFNQGNALSSVLATRLLGVKKPTIKDGLAEARVPGRMEKFTSKEGTNIYIDYAHNYLSLNSLLGFVRKEHPAGKLFVVIGSTGGKGVSRRVDFSKVLSKFADEIIFTTDDPGNENPLDIIQTMKDNLTRDIQNMTILDRREAIIKCLSLAEKGDSIVIAGKGTDQYQWINGERIPYEGDVNITEKIIGSGNDHATK